MTMGLPVVVVMIVYGLYNMADVFFMGQTGETLQVAAISLSGPAFNIFTGMGTLFGSGACTAIAIALGKGGRESVKYYSSFCVWGSVGVGVILAAAMLVFMKPLLGVMGANSETIGYASIYLTIVAFGSSGKIMVISLLGTFTNILLDPLFILVFRWGIAGAAAATVLGNVVSSMLVFLHIRKSDCFSISPKYFTLRKEVSLRTLSLGLPMAAGTVLMCFSSMFSNQLLVKYGNIALAANGVAAKAGMLTAMIVMGVCMGIQPAISYAFGAKDQKRLRSILVGTGVAATLLSTALGAGFLLGREVFVTAFLDDPRILEYGKLMVLGSMVASPLYGIYQLCSVYLQGTGKVTFATLTALLQKGIFYLPVLYLLEASFGLVGLVFAGTVTDVLSTAAGVALCLLWAKQQNGKNAEREEEPRLASQA